MTDMSDRGTWPGSYEEALIQFADRIETVLRQVPVRLGPNALRILEEGGTVGLSAGEYRDMALAVAAELMNPPRGKAE